MQYGETALVMAAREAQKDVVELLLEKGADVDATDMVSVVCCGRREGGRACGVGYGVGCAWNAVAQAWDCAECGPHAESKGSMGMLEWWCLMSVEC